MLMTHARMHTPATKETDYVHGRRVQKATVVSENFIRLLAAARIP